MSSPCLDSWLRGFSLEASLHDHVHDVITSLPDAIRLDFVTDPAFTICDYDPTLRAGVAHIPLGIPRARRPSRSVVLKRTLRNRPRSFVRYIIAHELAHAHLCNRGRWPSEDPEHAADALAAAWGYPNPLPGRERE
jgi:hypothetical protein